MRGLRSLCSLWRGTRVTIVLPDTGTTRVHRGLWIQEVEIIWRNSKLGTHGIRGVASLDLIPTAVVGVGGSDRVGRNSPVHIVSYTFVAIPMRE